ncbi:MAG: hypothetical protein IT233_11420 [Bacteroidia bacterium]|nr:hypothetical protein [Bacteroidia bacterium]
MIRILLFLKFVLLTLPAVSCDCPTEIPFRNALNQYDLIFRGKVTDTLSNGTQGVAVFQPLAIYKGHPEERIRIKYDATSSCLMSFSPGEEWIIYASTDPYNRNAVHFCGHSRKYLSSAVAEDHYFPIRKCSFREEDSILLALLGPPSVIKKNVDPVKQRELRHPGRGTAIWYILAAMPVLIIAWFLLKKHLR